MPRIANVSLLGVFLAGVAIFFVGFLWFSLLFGQLWMDSNGYTPAQIEENFSLPIFAVGGIAIPLIVAFAIGWLMKLADIKGLGPSIFFGAKLGILLAAPLFAYDFVYSPNHSVTALLLDVSHSLAGFMVGAAVLSFFD